MKKILLLSVLLFAFLFETHAQDVTVPYGKFSNFDGLKTEDRKLFYSAFSGKPNDELKYYITLRVFDDKFNILAEENIEGGYLVSVRDVEAHKGGLIFYIADNKEGTVLYIDKTGKKVWEKDITKDKGRYFDVEIRSLGDAGIGVVHNHKADKKGILFTLYDDSWNVKWEKGIYPDKGKIRYSSVHAAGDKFTVLMNFQGSLFSGDSGMRLATFSGKDQKLIYDTTVSGNTSDFYSLRTENFDDGSAFVAYYLKEMGDTPNSLNFVKVSASGEVTFETALNSGENFTKLMAIRPSPVLSQFAIPEELPYVFIHDVEQTDSGIQVIGETYYHDDHGASPIENPGSETAGQTGRPADVHILDYVVFKLSSNGEVVDIHRQKKPYKKLTYGGTMIGDPLSIGNRMEQYNFYAYSFRDEETGEIVSHNWHNNMQYVGLSKPEDDQQNILNRIYTGETVVKPEEARGLLTTYNYSEPDHSGDDERRFYNDVIPYHEQGKVIHYVYNNESGDLMIDFLSTEKKLTSTKNGKRQLPNIPAEGFKGVHSFEDGGYYTWYLSEYGKDSTAWYVYHSLDTDLNTINRTAIQVDSEARPIAEVKKGSKHVLVFKNAPKNEWHFYRFNNQGELESSNFVDLSELTNAYAYREPGVVMQADGSVTIIQKNWNSESETQSYNVVQFDSNYEVVWVKETNMPEDRGFQLISVSGGDNRLAMIYNRYNRRIFRANKRFISVYNLENGEMTFEKEVASEGEYLIPEYLQFSDKNELRVAGMYFEGKRANERNSDGLYVQVYDKMGELITDKRQSWKSIEEKLEEGTENDFLISGNVKVLIQDIVAVDGGFKVIGELFQKSAGTTGLGLMMGDLGEDMAFSILDFIVFDFAADGALQEIYKIKKPKQEMILPEYLEYKKGLSLSSQLRDYNVFSYRKTIGETNPMIVYEAIGEEGPRKIYQTSLAKDGSVISADAQVEVPELPQEEVPDMFKGLLEMTEKVEGKLDKAGEAMSDAAMGTSRTLDFYQNPFYGMTISVPGEAAAYEYFPNTYTVFLELKKME